MRVGVLGTGIVGQALAGRLAELGHQVVVGTRNVDATMARSERGGMGNPPYREWAGRHPKIPLAAFWAAAARSEIIVNATSGRDSIAALTAAGEENLRGKILVDVANPLDFGGGFPPTHVDGDGDSLGERIQAAFPDAKVVKTLNTVSAAIMIYPKPLAGGDHTVFVSGNDQEAKEAVRQILVSFGHGDVIDLGNITTARGPELYLPLWIRMMQALGTPLFNVKVVRPRADWDPWAGERSGRPASR